MQTPIKQPASAAKPVDASNEEKLKETLEKALTPDPVEKSILTAEPATPRRDDHEPKSFAKHQEPDVQRETLAAAITAQANAKKSEETFNFMSKFPNLTIYVNMGDTEREPGGALIRRDRQVQFKNGVFQTTDKKLAGAIRLHSQCGTQLFRETVSEELFHLRKAAAARGAATMSPTFAGATSSMDGGELGLLNQRRVYEDIENRIMSGAN